MKSLLLSMFVCFAPTLAHAYEPDVKQHREEHDPAGAKADRLIPTGMEGFPEDYGPPLHYLARFGRYPSFSAAFEWALVAKDRRYLLSSWRLERRDRIANPRRADLKEIEIPEELAQTIYSMWANAILDARYTRRGSGVDGTSYLFSTWLKGVGWPSATTWSPDEDLPPGWLVVAGELVLALGRAKQPDSVGAHAKLRGIQRRLQHHSHR